MNNPVVVVLDYLAAGCNNETGIFDELNGYILYAAGKNVLIAQIPSDTSKRVSCALPCAPRGRVHSCQWIKVSEGSLGALVASDDGFLRYYQCQDDEMPLSYMSWSLKSEINLESSVTLAAWIPSESSVFVVAATVKGEIYFINLLDSSVQLVKSYAPKKITALTVGILPNTISPFILAALSDSNIRVIVKDQTCCWNEVLSVAGHQNWITSLSVRSEINCVNVLSSSLDKSIRVWKIQQTCDDISTGLTELVPQKNSFTCSDNIKFSLVADSLALGHENAVYFAKFLSSPLNPSSSPTDSLEILSGSSDRSLIVWSRGFGGAWRTALQLGDLNGSLGTIGTDHTFSFYGGTVYNGTWIAAAASTGSILFWKRQQESSEWIPQTPITGHTNRVESITWGDHNDSLFLASTSKDQTTRIFSESQNGYREIARPQIHGYDLKCIAISSFLRGDTPIFELISGADEKVLRVFQAPKQFYQKLGLKHDELIPESAQLPALGLSNKTGTTTESSDDNNPVPENEGDLVRNSLWPETDKLYGHNQEISALALSPNRKFMATAAKSHLAADAALRLWTCQENESKWLPAAVVPAHNLTVSRLSFSPDSQKLLSVSRDRNLCLIAPETGAILCRLEAHSRMIHAAHWISTDSFVTGSRDKTVKFWRIRPSEPEAPLLSQTIPFENGITSLAVKSLNILAVGDEIGNVFIYKSENESLDWSFSGISIQGGGGLGPADSITDLKWNRNNNQLAVASADNSIRILSFYL